VASVATQWWDGAVVYEVFVRSFRDADGDGIGDLAGLTAKLDYLNDGDPSTDSDLGVDAIWLMPIFPSPSYHGYDVTDYDGVNPQYDPRWAAGASSHASDLDELITQAHKRGIKVILDWVPNHTSNKHPWFTDAISSPQAAHHDWYVWSSLDSGPSWYPASGAFYYANFVAEMPDLNWRNPAVATEIAAAAGRWIARGVDGFRLDAVRYLVENGTQTSDQPETHAALKAFAAAVRAARPDALILGEAWTSTAGIAPYFGTIDAGSAASGGDEVLPFDFPLAGAIITSVEMGSSGALASTLDALAAAYPAGAGDAPFLSNHDQQRVASSLHGDPAQLRLAAAILLTLQGTPIIYYGEEIGTQNGQGGDDRSKRQPLSWDGTPTHGFTSGTAWSPFPPGADATNVAAQTGDPGSLLSRYRTLIRVRKGSSALQRGGTVRLATSDAVLAYVRADGDETVLVAHNLSTAPAVEAVTLGVDASSSDALFADGGATLTASDGGAWSVSLPARGSGIWRIH
jgi:glycosidase